jgi:hypothetical protein
MAIKQEVNSQLILTVGAMSALLLMVIIIGLQAWFIYEEHAEVQAKWDQTKNVQLEAMVAAQRERIGRRGATTIPVDEAIKVVARTGGRVGLAAPATGPATGPATIPATQGAKPK